MKIDDFDMNTIRVTNGFTLFLMHTIALVLKRARYFKRDIRSLFCEILLPCIIVVVGLALMTVNYIYDSPELLVLPSVYDVPVKGGWSGNPDAKPLFEYFPKEYWDFSYYEAKGTNEKERKLDADLHHFKE